MNKRLLTIVLLNFVFICHSMAQAVPPRVQIISRRDTIGPYYNAASASKAVTVHLNLELSGDFDTVHPVNNDVTFEIIGGTLSTTPTFLNGNATTSVNLPASLWPGSANAPAQHPVTLTLRLPAITPDNPLSNDQVGQIIIQGHPSNFHDIVYSKDVVPVDTTYNPSKPFWVEVGTNFDMLDGMQASNLFTGVFFHKRDIRPIRKGAINTPRQKNLGVFAGVFESKTITTITNGDYGLHQYYDPAKAFMPGRADSLRVFSGSGPLATRQTVRNVGLFFSPQLRLSDGSANRNGLHFFISLWMEMQWQRFTWQKDYSGVINFDSTAVNIKEINKYQSKDLKSERDIKTHYYGIGFPVFFREESKVLNENVHLFINPVIGYTNQPAQKYLDSLVTSTGTPSRSWAPFYAFQFRLNEELMGVSFSGEVRGLLNKNNAPLVTLVLSKKFDLAKFMIFKQ